jgi:hypothetical protein
MAIKIDLHGLKCRSIALEAGDATRIGRLSGWAQGIEIFKVHEVHYLPQYKLTIWNGVVPQEAIIYPEHLDIVLASQLSGDAGSVNEDQLVRCDKEVSILGNIASDNFYHWTEELFKVIALEEFGFDGYYVVPQSYPSFSWEFMELLGISQDRIIAVDCATSFKAALFPTTIGHFKAQKFSGVLFELRDRLYDAVGEETGLGDRVWVQRGKSIHRDGDIVNKEEVSRVLQKHGFIGIDFAEYSVRKQIAIDRCINVLAGPHGASFIHSGFMKQKKDVIEIFSPNYINPCVIQICQAMEHRYSQIVPISAWHSPYQFGNDILVDIDHLELALSNVKS